MGEWEERMEGESGVAGYWMFGMQVVQWDVGFSDEANGLGLSLGVLKVWRVGISKGFDIRSSKSGLDIRMLSLLCTSDTCGSTGPQ